MTAYQEHDKQARLEVVLAEVTNNPGQCARELVVAIGETKSRVYQALFELEAAGSIVRSGDWPARWSPAPPPPQRTDLEARLHTVEQLLTEAMKAPGWRTTSRDVAHKVEHAWVELTRP